MRNRLDTVKGLTPPLKDSHQHYGMNTNYLKEILQYWSKSYDFYKQIEFLNSYPQFTTVVQGLNIHYVRVKPKNVGNKKVLPLLILHGWPGSVREFYEMIKMLTKPRTDVDFVFEVIAPSLPGKFRQIQICLCVIFVIIAW